MLLQDRIVLLTGATGGIGAAIAHCFTAQGARLVLAGRNQERLDQLIADLADQHDAQAASLCYEIGDATQSSQAFQRFAREHKQMDVLVNCAGIMRDAPLGMIANAAIDETLRVNVAAALQHTQYAARLMSKQGRGSIVNIASLIGAVGNANQTLYAASKAAVIGMTLAAAKELAPKNIRVNALAPGFIETAMTGGYPEAVKQKTLAAIGMGRFGRPEDVANAALFLASDLSGYITGQVIGVDGSMVI